MEQHPIPQNISGFQFKLIGDMTIRQFLYLAGGVFLAYLSWQIDLPGVLKWTFATFLAGGGAAFAFMPVEERPLDRWLTSFLKSIYAPTQFLWQKKTLPPEILTRSFTNQAFHPSSQTLKKEETQAKVEEYLASLSTPTAAAAADPLDQKEAHFVSQFTPQPATTASVIPQPVVIPTTTPVLVEPVINNPSPLPPPPLSPEPATEEPLTPQPREAKSELEEKQMALDLKIKSLQDKLNDKNLSRQEFIDIQSKMSFALKEREKITRELVKTKKQNSQKLKAQTVAATVVAPANIIQAGLPKSPTNPNTPSGIVKTQNGVILPGILVEIKNAEGLPVRALKTGKLGQFSVTTPLPDGAYTLNIEDPQKTYYFDIIEMTLKGEVLSPLEILAKTKKDKDREELTKKIFGNNPL